MCIRLDTIPQRDRRKMNRRTYGRIESPCQYLMSLHLHAMKIQPRRLAAVVKFNHLEEIIKIVKLVGKISFALPTIVRQEFVGEFGAFYNFLVSSFFRMFCTKNYLYCVYRKRL